MSKVNGYQCRCTLCHVFETKARSIETMKTTKLCVLILQSLMHLKPEKEFYSVKKDVTTFIDDHWALLSRLRQFQIPKWKKCILDAFNHCAVIESGKDLTQKRGMYRLKRKNSISNEMNEIVQLDQLKVDIQERNDIQKSISMKQLNELLY